MLLLQLSIVSHSFRQAVQNIIRTHSGLLVGPDAEYTSPVTFDSRLMLSWAPFITGLGVYMSAVATAGLPDFAALAQLTHLQLIGWDVAAYAHADLMLQKCTHLRMLSCTGWLVPTIFPPSLLGLQLVLSHKHEPSPWLASNQAALGFILRLARLPQLQHLTLIVNLGATLPSFGSQQLPALQRPTSGYDLAGGSLMDLNGLVAQPCSGARVRVESGICMVHQQIIAQALQLMRMQHVHLEVQTSFSPNQQHLWQSVRAVHRMTLTIGGLDTPLQLLPFGPELHIRLEARSTAEARISWQALLKAGTRVMIQKYDWHQLQIIHIDIPMAQQLGTPWQLTISDESSLSGLPPSLPSKRGTYFWQNRAATSAGWEQPDGWQCSSKMHEESSSNQSVKSAFKSWAHMCCYLFSNKHTCLRLRSSSLGSGINLYKPV